MSVVKVEREDNKNKLYDDDEESERHRARGGGASIDTNDINCVRDCHTFTAEGDPKVAMSAPRALSIMPASHCAASVV